MNRKHIVIAFAFCFFIISGFCGCAEKNIPEVKTINEPGALSEPEIISGQEKLYESEELTGSETVSGQEPAEYDFSKMTPSGSMELIYASRFGVDYYDGGYALVRIDGEGEYLVIPEGGIVPENTGDITIIKKPVKNIYLASSPVMDMFGKLDILDRICMTSTKEEDWSDEKIKSLVANKEILFVGKYSSPDYEAIVSSDCDLVIENTMIHHKPEVGEQLVRLGFPVMIERSSYEDHPLGRVEWIKLYGFLCDKEEEADAFMADVTGRFEKIAGSSNDEGGITTAFFYISSNGYVNVRKPGDYISKLIELAGGRYIFDDLKIAEENALSTVNLQMEAFYESAVDAQCLIYNSTVIGEIESIDDLVSINPVLADFEAVKTGNVYCTNQNMFQESTAGVDILEDFNSIFSGDENRIANMHYLHKLK